MASPIVVIIKKNGEEIRLCINYGGGELADKVDGIPYASYQLTIAGHGQSYVKLSP